MAVYPATGGEVGFGHLKRCLSIAEELRGLSYRVEFLADSSRDAILFQECGYQAHLMKKDGCRYNAIIVDKYNLNESTLFSYKKRCDLLVRIDDGGPTTIKDRISDVIINGNPYASPHHYNGLVRKDCYLFVGSKYIPMDGKLCKVRNKFKVRKNISSIVVTFGTSNKGIKHYAYNVAMNLLLSNLSANLLLPNGEKIRHKFAHLGVNSNRINLLPFIDDIGRVFLLADLVICSASSTCWQLAALGVPFIAFETAINQRLSFEYIKRTRIGMALPNDSIWNGDLERKIKYFDKTKREYYSSQSRKKVDCKGSRRIAHQLDRIMSITIPNRTEI